jgi:hypothetical protein
MLLNSFNLLLIDYKRIVANLNFECNCVSWLLTHDDDGWRQKGWDDDDHQRIDGSTMLCPVVGRRTHHNPPIPLSQHMHIQQQPPRGITGVRSAIPTASWLRNEGVWTTLSFDRAAVSTEVTIKAYTTYPINRLYNYLQSIVYTVTDRSFVLYDPILAAVNLLLFKQIPRRVLEPTSTCQTNAAVKTTVCGGSNDWFKVLARSLAVSAASFTCWDIRLEGFSFTNISSWY